MTKTQIQKETIKTHLINLYLQGLRQGYFKQGKVNQKRLNDAVNYCFKSIKDTL